MRLNSRVTDYHLSFYIYSLRYIIEKRIKRSPNPFTDISRDSANKNCRVMQINVQKLLTKNENDIKKGGAAAAKAKRVKDIIHGLKYVTDQKCKGKFLRHFANLREGPRGPRGAGVPDGVGRPGGMESRGVSLTLF